MDSDEERDEKPFPMDFFMPIVEIDESTPPTSSPNKKVKKIKIKIDGNQEGRITGEIVKPKRGRPRKFLSPNKNNTEQDSLMGDKEEGEDGTVSDGSDPAWNSGTKKKKPKKARPTKRRSKIKDEAVKQEDAEPEKSPDVEIKEEPKENDEGIEIKKEIKEEPSDFPAILPITEEDVKNIIPEVLELTKTYKCSLCTKTSQSMIERTPEDLKQHYKEAHPGKRLRISKFSSDPHPCDVCGKEFRSSTAVREHMETHSNYFYCEMCNASQKKILDHIIHMRVHSEPGVFKCLLCPYKTEEINAITDHVNKHDDLIRYWCGTCKKGFQILSWFQEHENYHTGLKPFDCEFCGKCFLYSRYLHAHKLNMHKEDVSFPTLHECVICKKQYQHKNSLKLHMNSHTGNYSVCDICGKMLSSKEKLKFHIRTHTGYKPYNCTYCEKSFTKKPILVEHVRIHTGERPYLCDYCTKAFSQRSSLVIHMRGHTGERPYVCQFCTKGFVAKAMLNIHLKTCKGAPLFGHRDIAANFAHI